jgi:hypothetical protein
MMTKKAKRTPARPTAEPQPAAAPAQTEQPKTPNLTALLVRCFRFDADAEPGERQLLSEILDGWERREFEFPIVAAAKALRYLQVNVSRDYLDNPDFREALNLFCQAVTGWGYGGLREQLITSLLLHGSQDMTMNDALAIFALRFQEKHSTLKAAREALGAYPAELADAIEKAMQSAPELRQRIAAKLATDGPVGER